MVTYNKFAGGIYGLLIGDALGVPYEFRRAEEIPPYDQIDMRPPSNFRRTYPNVEDGTWSDDGAQALCLLDSLLACGVFSLKDYSNRLSDWYQDGMWAIDGIVFDVGVQTGEALHAYQAGMSPEQCGLLRPDGKGNGALMRVLPLALWHNGTDKELVLDAHQQCLITHGHRCNQVCYGLYCLTARYLLEVGEFHKALEKAVLSLGNIYSEMPEYEQELECTIRPNEAWEGNGSGYVVDCLRSAFMIMGRVSSYEEAVKQGIMLGNDTDTTACVVGGLAGILFGLENIPKRWYSTLKGKSDVDILLHRALDPAILGTGLTVQ